MFKEFKEFALRGNVVDLSIGVMIGTAFNNIVNSLVEDILTPAISVLVGDVDFSNFYINLSGGEYDSLAQAQLAGAITINLGLFINAVLNFLVIALVLFLIIRPINAKNKADKPKDKKCPYCVSTIPFKATRCPHCTSQLKKRLVSSQQT